MDVCSMLDMSKEGQETYLVDLARRRRIAHERDIAREDRKYGLLAS